GDRDISEHLRGKRADRGRDRQREHRDAQKVDREERPWPRELAPDQDRAEKHGQAELAKHGGKALLVPGTVDRRDEDTEGERIEDGAQDVEAMPSAPRPRQFGRRIESKDAGRHIDREKPWPRSYGEDRRGDARADCRRYGDDHGV